MKWSNTDMLIDIKAELSGFIMSGYTGGFNFDEEAASELQQIEEKIDYLYKEMQDTIDYLRDALEWRKHKTEVQTETILQLRDNMKEIKKIYNDDKLTDEDVVNELHDLLSED